MAQHYRCLYYMALRNYTAANAGRAGHALFLPFCREVPNRKPPLQQRPKMRYLKLWQGLGYYSRGRNMLKTAQLVQQHYNGVFPVAYDQLIKLKGIGEYTAAAISSFSANEARAVVDGNVYRVLARYFGIDEPINSPKGKKMFQALADEVLNRAQPALHNQAMMEFGAMLCKPKNPACGICPVRIGCVAFKTNATAYLPVKLKTVKIRRRFFNYVLIIKDGELLMNKRDESDIWANMYDLPLIETDELTEPEDVLRLPQAEAYFGKNPVIKDKSAVIKHVLTHQHLFIRFIILDANFQSNCKKIGFIPTRKICRI
jgi:A/G-specific adenine glycosylase